MLSQDRSNPWMYPGSCRYYPDMGSCFTWSLAAQKENRQTNMPNNAKNIICIYEEFRESLLQKKSDIYHLWELCVSMIFKKIMISFILCPELDSERSKPLILPGCTDQWQCPGVRAVWWRGPTLITQHFSLSGSWFKTRSASLTAISGRRAGDQQRLTVLCGLVKTSRANILLKPPQPATDSAEKWCCF